MEHLAAHFKSGASLSQWWLKRTQFLESIPDWRGQILDLLQLDTLSDAPAICNYGGRLYVSVTEGERQHPQYTMWSCVGLGAFKRLLQRLKYSSSGNAYTVTPKSPRAARIIANAYAIWTRSMLTTTADPPGFGASQSSSITWSVIIERV